MIEEFIGTGLCWALAGVSSIWIIIRGSTRCAELKHNREVARELSEQEQAQAWDRRLEESVAHIDHRAQLEASPSRTRRKAT